MSIKVHLVPHMHWDREWYFTDEESKVLLLNNMEEILHMLETCQEYPFYVLDGQTAILEDYLALAPTNRDRIKALVRAGKLIIGPWYTQTDEMVVGGESIVRNLLYGLKDCQEFGPAMMIGYLPDSFGQSARMPQILNGFGINRCIFWRGTSERMGTDKTEFIWVGDDHSQVTVQLLPLGYAIGKYLPNEAVALKSRMDKYFPVLEKGAVTENLLLPNGHDQMPIQKDIFNVMKLLKECYPDKEFFLSRYEHLFDTLEQVELPILAGEFLDGKYMRVHRSIYSSRADLKSANTRIENKVTNLLEPLATIAYSLGFTYHEGMIESIWKELLKNHAHDSIGCCCSDKVHRIIGDRFFIAEEKSDRLIDFYLRKIADSMEPGEATETLTVFNTLPYHRHDVIHAKIITKLPAFQLTNNDGKQVRFQILEHEIIDSGLIDRQLVHYENYEPFTQYSIVFEDEIPAMGYNSYSITADSVAHELVNINKRSELENEYFRITILANGSLTIVDKHSGKNFNDVLIIEDSSDDGDSYDYSSLEDDYIVTSSQVQANVDISGNDVEQLAKISYQMEIPQNIESRKNKKLDSQLGIAFEIRLAKGSKYIKLSVCIDNQSNDHRVRLLIPSVAAKHFSVSDNQFGLIKRTVRDSAMDIWEVEQWSERPDSIYPFLSYVATDAIEGLAALTNSIREYEIIGDHHEVIALTLFRCVGYLGKEELFRRPGRPSGIKMPIPDSQMQGEQRFELGICRMSSTIARDVKEFLTPFMIYNKMGYNAMKLNLPDFTTPPSYSLMVDNKQAVLSCFKKAEQQEGIVLRYFNGSDECIQLKANGKFNVIGKVDLNEELLTKTNQIEIDLSSNQIVSYLVEKK